MEQRPTRPGAPAGAPPGAPPPPPGGTALELNDILKIALKGGASDIHLMVTKSSIAIGGCAKARSILSR